MGWCDGVWDDVLCLRLRGAARRPAGLAFPGRRHPQTPVEYPGGAHRGSAAAPAPARGPGLHRQLRRSSELYMHSATIQNCIIHVVHVLFTTIYYACGVHLSVHYLVCTIEYLHAPHVRMCIDGITEFDGHMEVSENLKTITGSVHPIIEMNGSESFGWFRLVTVAPIFVWLVYPVANSPSLW